MPDDDQSQGQTSAAASEQTVVLFDPYNGINTATERPGIPDTQAAWLDGFMPLAPGNLRTIYGVGTRLYAASGKTVVFFYFANLLVNNVSTPLIIIFQSDGSVIQINTSTSAAATILSAGTITHPSQQNCGVSQWNEQYVLLCSPDGYWVWDGSILYGTGTLAPGVVITNIGGGYAFAPSVYASGGHGSGATFVANLSAPGVVSSIIMTNPGSGYIATDTVSLVITPPTGGGSGATLTSSLVAGPFGSKTVGSVTVNSGGAGYSGAAAVTFSGGTLISGGSGATGNLTISGGTITAVNITYGGYYTSGSAAPAATVTDSGVGAAGTISLMPFGINGTTVETYSGHVWIANGANVVASAPGTVFNFATSAGGVQFISSSSVLRAGYTRLLSTNGFLYLIADSSIDYISGVQTSGTTTTFTLQNADPQVGSPYPYSVDVFGREIMLANSFGVHTMYGAAVTKVSDMLDGVYNSVPNFGGVVLSAAQATIFGRRVWMLLTQIVEPIAGQTVNKLFMWDRKRWWAASQDIPLVYVKHQEINSVITAWGTDGTSIYPLFENPSGGIVKYARTKLWSTPGGIYTLKANSRFWLMGNFYSLVGLPLQVTIDNELIAISGAQVQIQPTSTGYYVIPPQAVGGTGVFYGVTLQTNCADMAVITAGMDVNMVGYRG